MFSTLTRAAIARRSVLVLAALPFLAGASQDIRIVTYNIQDDASTTQDHTQDETNVSTVLEGIGQQNYNTNANGGSSGSILQKADVIGLEETYNTSTALTSTAGIISNLNSFYGSNIYAASPVLGTAYTKNPIIGNGPNALIYNQTTMNLMNSMGVGTPTGGGNGEFRQVMRYELQPLADKGSTTGAFYVYVSHTKSGGQLDMADNTTDGVLRNEETQIIRNDEVNLPSNASVLYVGDFNMDGSYETAYQTLTAATSPNGAAQGAGIDPLNVANNYNLNYSNASMVSIKTESDSSLQYRDDIEFMTGNVYNGSDNTLHLVAGSYHAFGNNGSTAYQKNTNLATNTALNDINGNGPLTSTTVLAAMNKSIGSDHLAVVADYSISITASGIWLGGVGNWSTASMWSNGLVPNSSTVEVKIDNSNTALSVVTVDQAFTVEDVTVDANDTLKITAGHSLALNGPPVSVFNGTFSNAGTLTATAINNSGSFNSTGTFSGTGNFNNSGNAALGGTQTWAAGVTLLNTAGTTTFTSDAGSGATTPVTLNLNVNVSGGGVVFSSNEHLKSLTVANGSTATVSLQDTVSSHTLIVLGSLNLAVVNNTTYSGKLDLTSNDLDVQSATLSTITSQILQGFNSGSWNGSGGIVSSAAASDSTHLTALGVIKNNQSGTALFTGNRRFDNTIPGDGDILVKYTYYGDANLSGIVDASDYSLIDSGYLTQATGWYNGDFNYDGTIDGSDYTLIDNAYNNQSASFASGNAIISANVTTQISAAPDSSTVPEPAGLAMISLAVAGLLGRRRNQID